MIMKIIGHDLASKIGWAENLGEIIGCNMITKSLSKNHIFVPAVSAENTSSLGGLVINIVVPLRELTASYRFKLLYHHTYTVYAVSSYLLSGGGYFIEYLRHVWSQRGQWSIA